MTDDDRLWRVLVTGWALTLLARVVWLPGGGAANVVSLVMLGGFTAALIAFGLRQLVRRRRDPGAPILRWALALAGSLSLAIGFAFKTAPIFWGTAFLASIAALIGLASRDTVRRLRRGGKPPDRVVQVGLALGVVFVAVAIVHRPAAGRASSQHEIAYALRKIAAGRDPGSCELATVRYLEQASESRDGPAGLYWCRAGKARLLRPRAVAVSDVRVSGDHATAEVAYRGGGFSGSKLRFGLAKRGEWWKVDRLLGFTRFDRRAFAAVTREYLRTGPFAFSPSSARCAAAAFDRYSSGEIQRLYVAGRSLGASVRIYLRCGRGAVVRSLAGWLAPSSYDHAAQLHSCVEEALAPVSDRRIVDLYRDPTGFLEIQLMCGRPDVLNAYRGALRRSKNNYSAAAIECTIASLRHLPDRALAEAFVDLNRIQETISSC